MDIHDNTLCAQRPIRESFTMFLEASASEIRPDEFMISSMLTACACISAAKPGEQLQGYALKSGFGSFTTVKNAQVCMYAESGDIDSAKLSFNEIENPNAMSWSVIMRANAQYGCSNEALQLFDLMKSCRVSPNKITFLGVLTACSHSGLVDGIRFFDSMTTNHGIAPNVKHYAYITDMLSRAGRLGEAEKFILSLDFADEPTLWCALLSGCGVYKDGTFGARAAKRLMELEPEASSPYVLLHNIYADSGASHFATDGRDLMTNRGVRKEPGLSSIEAGKFVDCFDAGDISHSKTREEDLLNKISKMCHVSEGCAYHSSANAKLCNLAVLYSHFHDSTLELENVEADLWAQGKLSFELMTGTIRLCGLDQLHDFLFSQDWAARKATYKKRKAGILKKLVGRGTEEAEDEESKDKDDAPPAQVHKFMTGEEIAFPDNIEELSMLQEDIDVLLGDIRRMLQSCLIMGECFSKGNREGFFFAQPNSPQEEELGESFTM
ncbi:Pentatricopeptide repeat-containing protein [Drosera capensis]